MASVNKVRCIDCKHFGSEWPMQESPYPSYWCNKNMWDGIMSTDELCELIECKLFEEE